MNCSCLSEPPSYGVTPVTSSSSAYAGLGLGSLCNATQMNGDYFELQIAREILATVRRCELPLQLDSLTEADGNCFPRFVI